MVDIDTGDIQKRIDALPDDLRQYVYSEEMNKVLQEIGRKNSLHLDQIGDLEAETASVMIGVSKPEDFVQNLVDMLNLEQPKAEAVAKDVNEMIFMKVRESMKKAAGYGSDASTAPVPVADTKPAAAMMSVPSAPTTQKPTPVAVPPLIQPTPAILTSAPVSTAAPLPAEPLAKLPAVKEEGKDLPMVTAADTILTQKTVNVAPAIQTAPQAAAPATDQAAAAVPATPQNYKADPYREPPI